MNPTVHDTSRSLVKLQGKDCLSFLNGLLTQDMTGQPQYAAFLTPQGKIITDIFIFPCEGGLLLDFFKDAPLLNRFTLYKLGADVTFTPLALKVYHSEFPLHESHPDPRGAHFGFRTYTDREFPETPEPYETTRLTNSQLRFGIDIPVMDCFPHDIALDCLNALSLSKGCYVGQEVVSRMAHKGFRKRLMHIEGRFSEPLMNSEALPLGTVLAEHNGQGLALIRTDRLTPLEGFTLTPPLWAPEGYIP